MHTIKESLHAEIDATRETKKLAKSAQAKSRCDIRIKALEYAIGLIEARENAIALAAVEALQQLDINRQAGIYMTKLAEAKRRLKK